MKLLKATLMVSTLALLGGCAVVPYDTRPYGYYGYYDPAPPVYYSPPVYVGPSFGVVIQGGSHRHGGHRHHWRR